MCALLVGSMFSGIGGICSSFQQAGAEIVWANEKDADAAKTYRQNFGDKYLIEDDIRNVDTLSIPDIDILTAGFPCQPFSIMGRKRGFGDPRGNLFFEISRVIDAKRPKIILLENVKHLIEHDYGKTFLVIYNTLAQFGYAVKYKVMNATEYGNIPQERKRIFIAAFLDFSQCDNFSFPETIELTTKVNDIIDRTQKHSDIYYYNERSPYYKELNIRIVDKQSIYRIDDSGTAKRRYTICPTLKANMGTYHDRVPLIRDDFGIRKDHTKGVFGLTRISTKLQVSKNKS